MKQVLLVDDEVLIRESMRDIVDWAGLGMEVAGCVSNGIEALECIGNRQIDIMITDIKMPYMNGLDLLDKLFHQGSSIIAIILSGYDDFRFAQQAIRYSVVDYLLKPVKLNELYDTLRSISARLDTSPDALLSSAEELTRFRTFHQKNLQTLRRSMSEAVCNGDQKEIEGTCEQFCCLFEENGYSTGLFVRSVLHTLYQVANDLSHLNGEEFNETLDLQEMRILSSLTSFSEIRSRFLQDICDMATHIDLKNIQQRQAIRFTLQTIHREYGNQRLNLSDLAEAYGITPNYLSSLFRKELGVTFSAYVESYRIEKAKKLLRDGTEKIYEVAEAVGYPDAHYFSKIFKEHVGKTPQDFRNNR